jgi:CheY-like chemotaxis protein/HPt (histidine-containing phosphotransfer) domain-containing protein
VLVVDDEEISRTATAGLLQSLGLVAEIAENGKEALEMSGRWPYVAIFMDCEMPEVDGYAALTQLHRREGANFHTPVIAVTARPQWVSVAAGMDHHIAKPVQIDALRADCLRLGLLASERPSGGAPPPDIAGDVPLLDAFTFGENAAGYRGPKLRSAAAFIEQATLRLPELWRAANTGDTAGLRRFALASKPLADTNGAARVSALCDLLSDAAAGREVGAAVSLEKPLRQAITDTGAAIKAWANGSAPPVASKPPASASDNPGPPLEAPAAGPSASARVVLADDDPLARSAIATTLRTAPWIDLVGEAESVKGIVELVAAKHPDVVVLDWMMPDGGGPEAARQILGQRADTLIVAITSSDSLEALTEMISAGASCLLNKAGSATQLTQTIARELKASSRARAVGATGPEDRRPVARPQAPREFCAADSLDPARIEQLKTDLGSVELLGELVELFRSQTPAHLIQLRDGIARGDAAAVSGHAHRLKGGCLSLAAERMAQLCDELEQSARAGSLGRAAALVDQIEIAFQQADSALRREVS